MLVFPQLQITPVFKIFLIMYYIIFQGVINLQVQVQITACLSVVLVLLFNLTWMPCRGTESALEALAGTKRSSSILYLLGKIFSISTRSLKFTRKPQQAAIFLKILSDFYQQGRSLTIVLMLFFKKLKLCMNFIWKSICWGATANWTVSFLFTISMTGEKRDILIQLHGIRS